MRESFKYAWKEIKRRKQRSVAAILSYAFIGAIVVVISSVAGITNDNAQRVLDNIGAHSVAYIPRLTLEGCCIQTYATALYDPDREGFVVNNSPTNLIPAGFIETIRKSRYVDDAAPYLMFRIRSSLGLGEWTLGGIDFSRPMAHSATVVDKSQVIEGEFINPGEDDRIMVEQEFASVYALKIGAGLQLGERWFNVAAIVNPPLRPGKANIYMTLQGLRELIATRLDEPVVNPVNAVLVESKGAKYHQQAWADIAKILGQSSRISSFGCSQPGVMAMGILENMAWTITTIVIVCMLLLAMKIQYSSVVQRKNDIGILKAIGWPDRDVISQIMTEAYIYAFLGGLTGIVLALTILLTLPSDLITKQDYIVDPIIFTAGLLLPLAGGTLSGVLSSVKAVSIQTADILRMA